MSFFAIHTEVIYGQSLRGPQGRLTQIYLSESYKATPLSYIHPYLFPFESLKFTQVSGPHLSLHYILQVTEWFFAPITNLFTDRGWTNSKSLTVSQRHEKSRAMTNGRHTTDTTKVTGFFLRRAIEGMSGTAAY